MYSRDTFQVATVNEFIVQNQRWEQYFQEYALHDRIYVYYYMTRKPSIEAGILRNAISYTTWNEI